jgi:myo-inositol 2-dehydrogenase/D-chiro-inositol 1-dehydrogenase
MDLGIGVIGTGVMGAEHARLLREETPGAHLAGVYDADPARAAACRAPTFPDPHALIASSDVAAVVIAAPDAAHAELTLACLQAGKPVLCEKPLAATAAQAREVVEAEARLGRKLIQVGYMRRFDPGYQEMKRLKAGRETVLLHNTHRNAQAPDWFTGAMAITNAFVHEIDISRWLTGSEMVSAQVVGADPLLITMRGERGEIVSTEVFMNAGYGYHVHAEWVGRDAAVEMAPPSLTLTNQNRHGGLAYPDNWVPRFAEAYRRQMAAFARFAAGGPLEGASAWDGYIASAIADQVVAALAGGGAVQLPRERRPSLYD